MNVTADLPENLQHFRIDIRLVETVEKHCTRELGIRRDPVDVQLERVGARLFNFLIILD